MKRIRRQPRTGDRRRLQIYLDDELHLAVMQIAKSQNVSRSRAARHLMHLALQSSDTSHGYRTS
jgi:hypothetical protein